MDGGAQTPSLDELLGQERWLQALARRLVRDAATADDLVQETWFRALRTRAGREPARGEVADARSWLARVLRNVWRERGRSERSRARREARVAVSEALPSARESLERIELQQGLAALVLELDEPYRSIVIARYHEGRSAAEIAADLGEPATRVRWRLMRARELLRQRLGRERGDWTERFALFLPLARRPSPPAAAAAGAAGVAGLGVLSMSSKLLLWVGAAALLAWTLVHFRGAASERSPESLASGGATRIVAADPDPGLAAAPPPAAKRAAVPPSEREAAPTSAPDAAARAGSTGQLRGIVRAAEDSRALADAELALFDRKGRSIQKSARSDGTGAFQLEEIEPGRYEVACRLAGRVPRRVHEVELVAGDETALEIELERGFAVTVEVVERASGAPVAAAEVQLIAGDRDTVVWITSEGLPFHSLSGTTSREGRVELGGAARGTYQYVIQAHGYATALGETLLESGAAPLRIALERGGVVYGTVLRANGTPAEGARVFLNPLRYVKALDEFVVRQNGLATDAAGRYRLEGVPEGVYHAVVLLADGSGSFYFDPAKAPERELARLVVEDSREVPLDFRLPSPGRVHGRVLDTAGAPIPGAKVMVSWGDFMSRGAGYFPIADVPGVKDSIHHSTVSDDQGRFTIETLRISHRPLSFSVRAQGHVASDIALDVAPDALLEPVITLKRLGASITGRLTGPDGAPIADQTVGAFETDGQRLGTFFQAQSAADGTYELKVPADPAGRVRHRVYPIVHDSNPLSSDPEKREGVLTGASGVDFVLRGRHRLHGTVVDDTGSAVRDFVVHALERGAGSEDPWEAVRDANRGEGRFDFFLGAARPAQLRFSAPGCDPCSITDLENEAERRIVLRRAGDLEGVVLDAEGRGVAGAVVALATLDSAIYPQGTEFAPRDTTDGEGRFRLRGVPDPFAIAATPAPAGAGHLLVCPRRDDAPPLLHYALPRQRGTRIELVLPRSVPVELEFVDVRGNPLEGGVVVFDGEGWPMEPALEVHLADQESSTRGVLSAGSTSFRLLPGSHQAVLVLGAEARNTFAFEVAGEDDATVQRHSFTVDAGR